jgi:hypothetical protein
MHTDGKESHLQVKDQVVFVTALEPGEKRMKATIDIREKVQVHLTRLRRNKERANGK